MLDELSGGAGAEHRFGRIGGHIHNRQSVLGGQEGDGIGDGERDDLDERQLGHSQGSEGFSASLWSSVKGICQFSCRIANDGDSDST